MNIIIAGAGKVGFNLAKVLSISHNVTIIDINAEALHRIQEDIDVMAINGDAEDINVYQEIKNINIDLFIAVTNVDNTNLVASLVSDTVLNIEKKIIRLKKEIFRNQHIKDKFNIDKFIFPIDLASRAISSLLAYPKANNIKFFKYTRYELVSIMVGDNFVPKVINEENFKIIGIERDKKFFIPSKDKIEIIANDLLYLFGLEEDIKSIYKIVNINKDFNINRCVVVGGSNLGIAIAKKLIEADCSVKLLEKDVEICQIADEKLEGKVSVINTKYNSHDVFKNESLDSADIFISTTEDDEFNIIKSLEAKENGIKKVVAINNDLEYYGLMHSLGIVAIRGPKISAYNKIMEEINSNKIVIQKSFCGSKAYIFIRKIFPDSKLIGATIKLQKRVDNTILFFIRDERLYGDLENIELQANDLIVAFSASQNSQQIKDWLYEL